MKYKDLLRKEEILSCVDLGWVVGCDDLWWRRQQLPEVDGPSKSFLLPQHLSVPVLFFLLQSGLLILTNPDFLKVKTKETNKLYRQAKSAKKQIFAMPFLRANVFHYSQIVSHNTSYSDKPVGKLQHYIILLHFLTFYRHLSAGYLPSCQSDRGGGLLSSCV